MSIYAHISHDIYSTECSFYDHTIHTYLHVDGKASGVRMIGGQEIRCKRSVVSGACYAATARLIDESVRNKYNFPLTIPGVNQSAGFVMCNIGINSSLAGIDGSNTNTWHIPIAKDGDPFGPIETFFENPLGDGVDIPG